MVGGAWDEGAAAQALGLGAGGRARTSAAGPDGPGGTAGLFVFPSPPCALV